MVSKIRLNDRILLYLALSICAVFFIAYSVLSVVRHMHYGSYGYDLGINNQVVWRYSNFQPPLTTSDPFPTETKLVTHVELVYALISPVYWIWSSAYTLLIIHALFMCASGIPVFLLARKRRLKALVSFSVLIAYLMFYGLQNAMWFDVHSASFAASFLAWFLYFLDSKKVKLSIVFLLLSITAKENIALLTLLMSFTYFIRRKDKLTLIFMIISALYLIFVYLIYFPHLTPHPYLYQNSSGLLSNLNPISLIDSLDKRQAIFYTMASFGFISLLTPLLLIPALGDFASYFILASDLTASHGIFMHYRVTLAPILVWATIFTISNVKRMNSKYVAIYLLFCTLTVQYVLHLPLSYLTKSWFWTEPSGVKSINLLKKQLLDSDTVVAQNNILPHISQRNEVYTLYPEKKNFPIESPCGELQCDWFRWHGSPTYLFVDTSNEWDIRHFLTDRENYLLGLENIEKMGIVKKYKVEGNAVIYKVVGRP